MTLYNPFGDPVRATAIGFGFLLVGGIFCCSLASGPRAAPGAAVSARLPEYLWTYRDGEGVVPPGRGTVFWILPSRDDPGVFTLLVFNEGAMSPTGLTDLLAGKKDRIGVDPVILYTGSAPSREITFHRMDIDGDGVDEVLLTGRGGAGGTSFLSVFRVEAKTVKLIFSDSSRFGFRLFDAESDGRFEIANPGFDCVMGDDDILREKQFTVYRVEAGKYTESGKLSPDSVNEIGARSSERQGVPLAPGAGMSILRVFDPGKQRSEARTAP